jgi:hypothetical protein
LQRIVDALRHYIKTAKRWDLVELALEVDASANLAKRERQRLRKEARMMRSSRADAQRLRKQREREAASGGPGSLSALRAMRRKKMLRRRGIW